MSKQIQILETLMEPTHLVTIRVHCIGEYPAKALARDIERWLAIRQEHEDMQSEEDAEGIQQGSPLEAWQIVINEGCTEPDVHDELLPGASWAPKTRAYRFGVGMAYGCLCLMLALAFTGLCALVGWLFT